jgi:hypothetical protein
VLGKSDTADLEISVKGSSEPTADLGRDGVAVIGVTLRHLLAGVFALHEDKEFSLAQERHSFP